MSDRLPPGKVPWEIVGPLLEDALPPEVRLGPALGEDAALIEIGGEVWAVASDPVSFTAADAGRLAVIINANDVSVRGARPRFFLAVGLIAPHEASEERIRDLLNQVRRGCREVGATLIGGHTEVTPGLPHSMVIGTMLGRVEHRPLTTGGLRAGDLVAMTRSAGIEGTSILLAEYGQVLQRSRGHDAISQAAEELSSDWLLVAHEALEAAGCASVTALHDVTEGGVGEALHEMARASGLTIDARREDVPILPVTEILCGDLGIDPLGLIGSGSILIGCDPDGRMELAEIFAGLGVPLTWIGHAIGANQNPESVLPRFPRDELLKTGVMNGIKAVIFDMDGTLIDSHYDWPLIRTQLGVDGASIIDDLNGLDEPLRTQRWTELERIENEATATASMYRGARELLNLLSNRGISTALVTNNTDKNTHSLVDRFDLEFDVILTRDSGFYKPSGAPIVEAVRQLGCEAEECLAVGDSRYDILAAREAALRGICVLNDGSNNHSGDADLSFADIPALIRYLEIVLT